MKNVLFICLAVIFSGMLLYLGKSDDSHKKSWWRQQII